jgi:hypothetical protein
MDKQTQIAQIRYSINEALESVPKKHFKQVKEDVKKLLGIKSRQQLLLYQNGTAMPKLDKARAVEEYFLTRWGIDKVWKEVYELDPGPLQIDENEAIQ